MCTPPSAIRHSDHSSTINKYPSPSPRNTLISAGRLYATPLGLVVRCFSASDMLESDPPRNAGVFMRSTMRRKPALKLYTVSGHRLRPMITRTTHSDTYLQLPTNVFNRFHSTHESNMIFRRLRLLHSPLLSMWYGATTMDARMTVGQCSEDGMMMRDGTTMRRGGDDAPSMRSNPDADAVMASITATIIDFKCQDKSALHI
ncbi:hypothetical protein DFH07DRAFT_1058354 [Mycena maculata]|uniref:Uncharacterized protein n=1 Tax=Mycena maculata TaxID=230809 RepID=A0AAD7NMI2_9AGAR|nr:hypothetical protein DFH07DRAFT_1058354 [Mycena maculata]